jgi:small subunit ribosomal protein S17
MPRRILEGTVVSDAMDKTVVVKVERRVKDALYGKFVTKSNKFSAHDEKNVFKIGDTVQIEECPPISKNKSWKVISNSDAKAEKAAPKKKEAAAKAEKKTTKKKEAKAE